LIPVSAGIDSSLSDTIVSELIVSIAREGKPDLTFLAFPDKEAFGGTSGNASLAGNHLTGPDLRFLTARCITRPRLSRLISHLFRSDGSIRMETIHNNFGID
jgi:hypothetical protein